MSLVCESEGGNLNWVTGKQILKNNSWFFQWIQHQAIVNKCKELHSINVW